MCGLVGAAGKLEAVDQKVFSELLWVAGFRGMDSTGVAARSRGKDAEASVIKQTVSSPDFLDSVKVRNCINSANMLLLGHTRSRTFGSIDRRNAQPFDFDEVVGTHNGTLSHGAKGRLEGVKSVPTDSEALYFRMNEEGLDGVTKLTDLDDAMALVWFEKKTRTLNFYRNEKRTLYYTFDKKLEKVYWASEAGMLYLVLNRNNVAFSKIKFLPAGLHWSVVLPEDGGPLPKTVTRFCEQPKSWYMANPHARTTIHYGSGFSAGVGTGTERRTTVVPGTVIEGSFGVRAEAVEQARQRAGHNSAGASAQVFLRDASRFRLDKQVFRLEKDGGPFYKSPNGKIYNKEKFEEKAWEACCVCGINPAWGEPVKFLRDESICCASCVAEAKADAEHGKSTSTAMVLLSNMS